MNTQNTPSTPVKPKKKMKLWAKILISVLSTLLVLILAAVITVYAVIGHYYNMMHFQPIEDDDDIIYDPDETEEPDDWEDWWGPDTDDPVTSENPGTSDNPGTTDDPGSTNPPKSGDSGDPVTPAPPTEMSTDEKKGEQGKIDDNVNKNKLLDFGKNVTNILLIGSDARKITERGRSDTMIILSINKDTKQIVLTSLMRDIYLHIPTVNKYNRINAAYSWGGVSLLLDTIEENFKIHIDKYVRVNFEGFKNIINGIGGIDVKLTQAEINYLGLKNTTPGVVHLNGANALRYARCRKVSKDGQGADFARTLRQREVLDIVFNKIKDLSIPELDKLLSQFLPQVATNLTQSEITGYLLNSASYAKYEVKSYRLPVNGAWNYARINGMSVLSLNFDKCVAALEKYIKGEE